jgi:hypothetical protein
MDTTPRPLIATADTALAEELARLAAAAGAPVAVASSADAVLAAWPLAPVVLLGADLAPALTALAPARRPGVLLVCWAPAPPGSFRDALLVGADSVVELPAGGEQVAELLTDLGEVGRPEGAVVAVVGGSGGAGATTLACALGQVAGASSPALVVDLDPIGPGCDVQLALDDAPGVRWDSLGTASGRLSGRSLREAVPRRDVDLPRHGDLVPETLARATLTVVVVVPTPAGVGSAARWVARLADRSRVGLVVRGRCPDPGRVAVTVDAPVLAVMAPQRGLAEAVDLGLGPVRSRRGPLARAARSVLADVAPRAVAA